MYRERFDLAQTRIGSAACNLGWLGNGFTAGLFFFIAGFSGAGREKKARSTGETTPVKRIMLIPVPCFLLSEIPFTCHSLLYQIKGYAVPVSTDAYYSSSTITIFAFSPANPIPSYATSAMIRLPSGLQLISETIQRLRPMYSG